MQFASNCAVFQNLLDKILLYFCVPFPEWSSFTRLGAFSSWAWQTLLSFMVAKCISIEEGWVYQAIMEKGISLLRAVKLTSSDKGTVSQTMCSQRTGLFQQENRNIRFIGFFLGPEFFFPSVLCSIIGTQLDLSNYNHTPRPRPTFPHNSLHV